MDLSSTIRVLNCSGIQAAAAFLPGGEIHVWLGDAQTGVRDTAVFRQRAEAAAWLTLAAVRHFPASDFAKVRRFLARVTAQRARHSDF
jgi:hypothetical protein